MIFVPHAARPPRGYGFVRHEYIMGGSWVMPVPLNILARWVLHVWDWLTSFGANGRRLRMELEADNAYLRSRLDKLAQDICDVRSEKREITTKLVRCQSYVHKYLTPEECKS